MTTCLPCIETSTGPIPTGAVIWLHGLGATGDDFAAIVPELDLTACPPIRFVFPHAPSMPVTINGGYVMPAWYDIITLEKHSRRVDEAGIVHSRQAIRQLIESENQRGIPCERIFLAGFSQGGAVAYTTALTHPEKLAGLIALSTYIPVQRLLTDEMTAANKAIPVFAAHGMDDDVVAPELGMAARDFLLEQGYSPEWHEYPMPHSVCLPEVKAIGKWLKARMAAG